MIFFKIKITKKRPDVVRLLKEGLQDLDTHESIFFNVTRMDNMSSVSIFFK
jgi:hypothetical protein